MPNKNKSIVRDGIYTLSSNYFAQACNIIRSFYSANILGPTGYGIWSVIQFYLDFGKFSLFGMDEATSRDITQNILKKKTAENMRTIKMFSIYSIITALIVVILGVAVLILFGDKNNPIQYYGIIFIAGSLLATQMDRFAYALLSAYGKFNYASLMRGIYAVVSLGIVVVLVKNLEVIAMYWSYFVGTALPPLVILVIYLRYISKNYGHTYVDSKYTSKDRKAFLRSSFSLLLVSALNTLLANLDRFFVAQAYSNHDNGIYFFAGNIAMSLNLFIFSFTVVIYQRMNLLYGENSDKKMTFEYIIKACKKAAIYFPYVIIFAYYIIPSFFIMFFPQYIESTFFLRCFTFAGYFYSIFMLLNYELVAIKKQKMLNIVYVAIGMIGSTTYVIACRSLSIKLIPYIVVILNVLMMLINLYLSRKISGGIYKKRKLLLALLSTPAMLLVILKISDHYLPGETVQRYIMKAGLSLLIYFMFHKIIDRVELKEKGV